MAKAAVAKTASKPASKGKSTTKPTTPVARPAIGKDDKALKEDADAEASSPNPAPVAGKKRKSSASSTGAGVKDPEHDPETVANTTKNSKSHSAAPKDAAKITEGVSTRSERDGGASKSKKAKVHVNKPAVTEEKTTEEVPLPVVVASSSKGKKPSSKKTTTSTATTTAAPEEEDTEMTPIAPSASKPSAPLKSALKSKSKSNKKPAQTDAEFIHGFSSSSDEGESEDEDDSDVDVDMDAGKKEEKQVKAKDLPKVVEGDKTVQEKLEKAKKRSGKEKGVLYLGRIPHGFYEEEMKAYFSQFGDISRLRLARNKKTGASKHFAYIEMPNKSVAEITAETMHNYLLMGHILQCHVVPADKIHPDIWIGANRKWRRVPSARLERSQFGKDRTEAQQSKTRSKLVNREKERKTKMKAAGIDYEYEGFTA